MGSSEKQSRKGLVEKAKDAVRDVTEAVEQAVESITSTIDGMLRPPPELIPVRNRPRRRRR